MLKESDDPKGWRSVPDFLKEASIYSQWKRPTAAIADFSIVKSGVVYLACHFGYEGNSSGGWKKRALTQEQFVQRGWKPVAEMRSGNGRIFNVLRKPSGAGEHFSLQCNKYTTPMVILLPSSP